MHLAGNHLPRPRAKGWGYLARVFLDNQWHFPIRVEVYELPLDRGKGRSSWRNTRIST